MNKDNIISAIPRVSVVTQPSKKTGNDYTQLCVHFHDGYVLKTFLSEEQRMLIKNAIESRKPDQTPLDD